MNKLFAGPFRSWGVTLYMKNRPYSAYGPRLSSSCSPNTEEPPQSDVTSTPFGCYDIELEAGSRFITTHSNEPSLAAKWADVNLKDVLV